MHISKLKTVHKLFRVHPPPPDSKPDTIMCRVYSKFLGLHYHYYYMYLILNSKSKSFYIRSGSRQNLDVSLVHI